MAVMQQNIIQSQSLFIPLSGLGYRSLVLRPQPHPSGFPSISTSGKEEMLTGGQCDHFSGLRTTLDPCLSNLHSQLPILIDELDYIVNMVLENYTYFIYIIIFNTGSARRGA